MDTRKILTIATTVVGLALWSACGGDQVTGTAGGPSGSGGTSAATSNHSDVYLAVSSESASPGDKITVAARFEDAEGTAAPAGFVARLHFDSQALSPVQELEGANEGLTLVNLSAGDGVVGAAGASPDAMTDPTLFGVEMKVQSADYLQGLSLEIRELNIVQSQGSVADVSGSLPGRISDPVVETLDLKPLSQKNRGLGG